MKFKYKNEGSSPVFVGDVCFAAGQVIEKDGAYKPFEQAVKNGVLKMTREGSIEKIEEGFTILFDRNGHGKAVKPVRNVKAGEKITFPAAPTEEGFTFGGWFKDRDLIDEWVEATTEVDGNATLYAKWTEA